VTTAKIADLNVTNGKLAADSVTGDKILAGTIVTSDLTDNAVTKTKMEVKTASSTAAVGMVAMSSSSGSSVVTVPTNTTGDIPNNSVTITTRGGPVLLQLLPGPSPTVNSYISCDSGLARITFSQASTIIDRLQIGPSAGGGTAYFQTSGFSAIDVPAAGTYTYKAGYVNPSGSGCSDLEILNVRLMAYEL